MSKIWKKPIEISDWIHVSLNNNEIFVKWPKWELSYKLLDWVKVDIKDKHVDVFVQDEEKRNIWWLTRTLIMNMVEWVSKWFEKKLIVMWVWYVAKLEWTHLLLSLWFSHKVKFEIPKNIQVKVEQDAKWNTIITLNGIDKQYLGEIAAKIKALKTPEPYKWKWIRYSDEYIKIKPGKAAKK